MSVEMPQEVQELQTHMINALNAHYDGRSGDAINEFRAAMYSIYQFTLENAAKLYEIDLLIEINRLALRLRPDSIRNLIGLMEALGRVDDKPQALGVLERIQSLDSHNPIWPFVRLFVQCPHAPADEDMSLWLRHAEKELDKMEPLNILEAGWLDDVNIHPGAMLKYFGTRTKELKEKYGRSVYAPVADASWSLREGRRKAGMHVSWGSGKIFVKTMRGILENWDYEKVSLTVICDYFTEEYILKNVSAPLRFLRTPGALKDRAATIRKQSFDVLYFWESGNVIDNSLLPYFRLAPVQCTSLGTADTTGNPEMDYYLTSELFEPEGAAANYTERLHTGRSLLAYYDRPVLSQSLKGRAYYGLPEESNIYLCPQNLSKVHPDMDQVIEGILSSDKRAEVVFIKALTDNSKLHRLSQRFKKTIPSPLLKRIGFVSYQENERDYYGLLAAADVMIDTLHYTGHTTSAEALGLGVPVVTLPGEFFRGRATLAMYRRMDYLECVATSSQEYVSKAVRLGTDSEYRESVRREIQARNSALFEDLGAVRELEDFFMNVTERSK